MSIYFDYKVGSKGRMFRRAVESDKHDIELIWKREHTENLFCDPDIGSLIELSALSICMVDENKEVIGFMALSDHPNVLGVDPSDWENWIRNLYRRYYLSRSTLFIHFMCCVDSVTDVFVEEALISVFLNDSYILYIVLVVPIFCPDELISRFVTFRKRNILKYLPKVKEGFGNYLYTALRIDFCPKLKMRRAVEEDNDDIVEILDKKCPRLKELYGEYYISEIIGRHPEFNRKVIVADIQGRAVAVMCLNTEINYKKLQTSYELKPFHGLQTATSLEKEQNKRKNVLLTDFGDPILRGQWSPFQRPTVNVDRHKEADGDHTMRSKKDIRKVNVEQESQTSFEKADSEVLIEQEILESPAVPSICASVVEMLDEDPFDYDIVNIDTTLFNLNEGKSFNIIARPSLKTKRAFVRESLLLKQHQMFNSSSNSLSFKKTLKPKRKFVKLDDEDNMTYQGTENAFIIELFAIRDDIDDRYAYDLLEAAFELLKDLDYCIIRVPSADKTFPLLQHFCFVPAKPKICCEYSLYIAHRSSVLGKLRVREAEIMDIPEIAILLANTEAKDTITHIENTIKEKENLAYIFTTGMHIIGLGILEPAEQIDCIRGRYNLDSYQIHKYHYMGNGIQAGFATVKCTIVYPVFEPHYRFFAREMMRLSGNNTLLWLTPYRNKWTIHKANSIVASMIPLTPRTVEIDCDAVPELKKISVFTEKTVPFSTWFIGRKFTTIPKAEVNTRIVVIGAAATALGFLNGLLFSKTATYLTFNNVTVISPNGLPYTKHNKPVAESMFLRSYVTTDKYLKCVPYSYYVNVVQGTLMEMDLQEKYITLTSGNCYYYDLLFLFFGKQYQHPDHMVHLIQRDMEYKHNLTTTPYIPLDKPRFSDTEIQIANDETPENVFIINSVGEANKALDYVKKFADDDSKKVIVYGSTIHAYLCVNALLDTKIRPENIIFIEPFPPEHPEKTRVPVFDNVTVDQTVIEVLDSLKVKVYRSYYFKSWKVTVEDVITHADFLSYADYLNLECSALFYYGRIGVNMRAFIAIHKSGLAYDGGVVIDYECRTLDPYVFAAGPCTRYHKRYYADARSHKYYDSTEIGEKLGIQIRKQLDPLFTETTEPFSQKWPQAEYISFPRAFNRSSVSLRRAGPLHLSDYARPEMSLLALNKPKVMHCVLPGGLKYLEVRSPGLKTPHNYVQSLAYNGYVFETYKTGYFKMHLNKEFVVDGITCLCLGNYSLENFKYLYGRPASELNNMHLRYMANRLDDFYEFFRSSWAFFLYHDHADDLFAMIKQLYPKGRSSELTLKEALCRAAAKWTRNRTITLESKLEMQRGFENSSHIEALTEFLIDWLTQHDILLPMYLQPGKVGHYEYDLDNNPFIMKKAKRRVSEMIL
ncbi:cilia- and flagella-associated protein 61-like [Spodoptera frugiperda]|uniref:Cilia- and flagella-associated protein 61-like n=1 Tax=Spodoptera frugiperda TaxID=7108 RepID=A0A9R0EJM6_SPOFR|nr:cilia- and flagella-associated protein 61-like [Spodoptera frugiperda]